jgi:hypothetical protein
VSFQDFEAGAKESSEGLVKIQRCCALARQRGFDWVWIDTRSIDKKSSAELSEAINSMYRWYEDAGECYAYLNDVTWVQHGTKNEMERSREEFRDSKWFTRGWTLQELLAPKRVLFFDRNWTFVGWKRTDSVKKRGLASEISNITNIAVEHLQEYWRVKLACVAVKMSLISKRQTSRSEDMAYCMLGLFDVNMPLLYGEGRKAFLRLQSEIIKQSNDESIFAWIADPTYDNTIQGLFAPAPTCFAESGTVKRLHKQRPPWSMTHMGLAIHVPNSDIDADGNARLKLGCWKRKDGEADNDPIEFTVLISLYSLPQRGNMYCRVSSHEWLLEKAMNWPSAEGVERYYLSLHCGTSYLRRCLALED